MNRFARFLALFFVLSQSLAMADPDYSECLQAATRDFAKELTQSRE